MLDSVITKEAPPAKAATNGQEEYVKTKKKTSSREISGYVLAGLFVLFEVVLAILIVYLLWIVLSGSDVSFPFRDGEVVLGLFNVLPIVLVLSWLAVMIGYFAWCTFFYNFNFGRSSQFWTNFVSRVREARLEGKTENQIYEEMAAPRQNPYADETFGFPPGTIRGALALTITVGGLALLISFLGGDAFFHTASTELVQDYFEFFKTAFLMVVAFYFGTKGLDIIERERTRRMVSQARIAKAAGTAVSEEEKVPGSPRPPMVGLESPSTTNGKTSAATVTPPTPPAAPTTASMDVMPTLMRTPPAAPSVVKTIEEKRAEVIAEHYPQVADNEVEEKVQRELGANELEQFAEQVGIDLATVHAVVEVESSGKGFLTDGRPKILFEGHVFWRQLVRFGIDPAPHAAAHPSIVYRHWTRQFYLGGAGEYDRLEVAKRIHETAALCSASWGLFQIMGFNHKVCGFDTVQEFVDAQEESEKRHLEAFLRFLENTKTSGGTSLLDLLRQKDWANFARHYNGAGYKQNKYDVKLANAYEKHTPSVHPA